MIPLFGFRTQLVGLLIEKSRFFSAPKSRFLHKKLKSHFLDWKSQNLGFAYINFYNLLLA